jgi:hypothetical protein
MWSRSRILLPSLFAGFLLAVTGVSVVGCSSQVSDGPTNDQAASVEAGKTWWMNTRRQVRDLKTATGTLQGDAQRANALVSRYLLDEQLRSTSPNADASAAQDEEQVAAVLKLTESFLPIIKKTIEFTTNLEKSLAARKTLILPTESRATNTVRNIPEDKMVQFPSGGGTVEQNWGIRGALQETQTLRKFLQSDVLQAQNTLAADGRSRSLAEQAALFNAFTASVESAKDRIDHIRLIVDSWWDYDATDFDACDPYAAGNPPSEFANLSCKWWPHVGYMRYMKQAERPCVGDRAPSLPGTGAEALPEEQGSLSVDADEQAYYSRCANDIHNVRSALQSEFNWVVQNQTRLLYRGDQEGKVFVDKFLRQTPELKVTALPPVAGGSDGFECDAEANTVKVSVSYAGGIPRSLFLRKCGLEEKPPVPTCALRAEPAFVTRGGSTQLRLEVAGNADTISFDGQVVEARSFPRTVTPQGNSQRYAVVVKNRGGQSECSIEVGVNPPPAPPTCELRASVTTVNSGGEAFLTLVPGGGPLTSFTIDGRQENPARVSPAATTEYVAQVNGPGGSNLCKVTIQVAARPREFWCAGGVFPAFALPDEDSARRCGWDVALQGDDCAAWARFGRCEPVTPEADVGWKVESGRPRAPINWCQCVDDAELNSQRRAFRWVGRPSNLAGIGRQFGYSPRPPNYSQTPRGVQKWPWQPR